jgi:hypothetical protein
MTDPYITNIKKVSENFKWPNSLSRTVISYSLSIGERQLTNGSYKPECYITLVLKGFALKNTLAYWEHA